MTMGQGMAFGAAVASTHSGDRLSQRLAQGPHFLRCTTFFIGRTIGQWSELFA
jgi:hypothetical protein